MNQGTTPDAPAWVRAAAHVVPRLPAGRYRVIDRLCRRPPPPFLMRMAEVMGGSTYLCDLRDSIAREVCFTGRYGPQESLLVRSLLDPGATFVDVGANWGYFTLAAARLVGPSGRVVSLEPDPRLFRVLSDNVARNGLANCTLLQTAAAAEPGELVLAGYDETAGNFGLSRIVSSEGGDGVRFRVEAAPLDAVLEANGVASVDLLKMDIEGAEAFAVAGLRDALARGVVRYLMVELHPEALAEHGTDVAAIVRALREAGYEGYTVDHTPETTRAVAYGRVRDPSSFLRPLSESGSLDAWPHQLWRAPGAPRRW